jgi:hypothetical protein
MGGPFIVALSLYHKTSEKSRGSIFNIMVWYGHKEQSLLDKDGLSMRSVIAA